MHKSLISAAVLAATVPASLAQMKVVALHPLMADLARKVGGANVEVIALMRPNDDAHHFNPAPDALHRTQGAKIYLASGMGLESYLGKLRSTLGGSAVVLEVGATLPARETHELCEHGAHAHGEELVHNHRGHVDPHWWHRVQNMQRAADIVAGAFAGADPAHAASYQANARAHKAELARLHSWIRRQLIRIPRPERKLVTAHDSFGYFCDEYGFKSFSIKGINKSSEPSAGKLAEIITTIRREKIRAIFPEQRANPKALQTLASETGITIGGTLIADGSESYLDMMQHNVRVIVAALAP